MALDPSSFIEPVGELSESLFPDQDLEEYVTAWLTDACARTGLESAQRAWVYHRAYRSVANRMNAELASERKGDASASRLAEQFRYWQVRAEDALSEYQGAAGNLGGPVLAEIGFVS